MPRPPLKLVTAVQLAAKLGVHRATVSRWAAAGTIPAPLVIGDTAVWRESIAAQIVARHARHPEPPTV